MLSTNNNTSYKNLARNAVFRECMVSDNPLSEMVVDVRSRIFLYIRTAYVSRPLKSKIVGLFRAIKSIEDEMKYVFKAAITATKRDVSMMHINKVTYVFGHPQKACKYKEELMLNRKINATKRFDAFKDRVKAFEHDMLNIKLLKECITALESYIIANLEGVCSVYSGKEWLFVPKASYVIPKNDDMFESDRTCARLGRSSSVLSEDFDCVALFGANLMIKDVYEGFFSYTTLKDVMDAFKSTTKRGLAEKCCIMGTDYNYGLKGVGPVKASKIDDKEASRLCKICLSAQHIKSGKFFDFLQVK